MTTFVYLKPYDSLTGRPDVSDPPISVPADVDVEVGALLKAEANVLSLRPGWNKNSSLDFTTPSTASVVFLEEEAGYRNALMAYFYDTDAPPTRCQEIDQILVVFPNASAPGKGGNLEAGFTVNIPYEFTTTVSNGRSYVAAVTDWNVPAGKSLGFICGANVWRGSYMVEGSNMFATDEKLNPESDASLQVHFVNFVSQHVDNFFVYGTEDINRTQPWCDHDFNDLIFGVQVGDLNAIHPRCVNYTTLSYEGTVMCEDLNKATAFMDRDYNDLVGEYKIVEHVVAGSDDIAAVEVGFVLKHRGANYDHDFGLIIPHVRNQAGTTIIRQQYNAFAQTDSLADITAATIGTETDRIVLIEGTKQFLTDAQVFANTQTTGHLSPSIVKLRVQFPVPVPRSELGNRTAPYQFFLRCYRRPLSRDPNFVHEFFSDTMYSHSSPEFKVSTQKEKIFVLPGVTDWKPPIEKTKLVHAYKRLVKYLDTYRQKHRKWWRWPVSHRVVDSPLVVDGFGWESIFVSV